MGVRLTRSASVHIVSAMPGRRIIGVDVGGTKLLAGAVDTDFFVHRRVQRSVSGLDLASLLDCIADAVRETSALAGGEVEAVGFGIPSLIDRRTGRTSYSTHHPLFDIPFADVMAERLGVPVFVDNDANAAVVAEYRAGAARGHEHVVLLTLGTGIGGGLILGGELYRGAHGNGAELGHITIDMNGPRCNGNCPNHGCLEALASGTALARESLRIAGEQPSSRLGRALTDGRALAGPLVSELAHDGDSAAIEAITFIGIHLGIGIASL